MIFQGSGCKKFKNLNIEYKVWKAVMDVHYLSQMISDASLDNAKISVYYSGS